MTQQRKDFEAWAKSKLGDNSTWRESGDCELAWQAWQAAQAAQPARPKTASHLTDKEYSDPEYMRGYVESLNEIADNFAARLAQPAQIPEGWKLVPVEPTEAMLEAGPSAELFGPSKRSAYLVYKAMLSAAPSTKEGKQ